MFINKYIDNLYSEKNRNKRTVGEADNEFMRNILFNELQAKWKNIATSIFVWNGFEDDFISSQIEKLLYENDNGCVVYKDFDGVEKVFSYTNKGGLNAYGQPVKITAIGLGGYTRNLDNYNRLVDEPDKNSGVIIYNNKVKRSPRVYLSLMISKLVNLEGAIDININSIKAPFIANVNEDSVLAVKNMYRQVTGNTPVIFADKGQQLARDMTVFQTGAKFYGTELNEMYNRYEGRMLNTLGLQYIHNDKKERMVVAEVNKNDEYTNMNLASGLNARQRKAKLISKMLGKEITVDVNPLIKQMTNEEILSLQEKDGEKNACELHNITSRNNRK